MFTVVSQDSESMIKSLSHGSINHELCQMNRIKLLRSRFRQRILQNEQTVWCHFYFSRSTVCEEQNITILHFMFTLYIFLLWCLSIFWSLNHIFFLHKYVQLAMHTSAYGHIMCMHVQTFAYMFNSKYHFFAWMCNTDCYKSRYDHEINMNTQNKWRLTW